MKNYHRTPNTIKSLTLLLSLADGVSIENVQGKRYRITCPLNGLVFDNHGAAPAWFYAIFPPQLGGGATPAPAGVRLVGHHVTMTGSDADDPRQAIVSQVAFEVEFAEDAASFEAIPLVVKGFAAATNAPASFTLPSFTPSEDPEFAVTDTSDGPVLLSIEEPQVASGGGSVESVTATLPIASTGGADPVISIAAASGSNAGSMSAAHYNKLEGIEAGATANDTDANLKNRANHTGTQAISTVTGLQSALDDKQDASSALALGETSGTAHRGDRGKTAYDHAQLTSGNPHNVTKADVGLGDVDNTSDANKPVSTATQEALDGKLNATPEAFASLADGGTITWDTEGKPTVNATVTLGGNRTLSITNAVSGTSGILIVKQDGSGNRTLALPSGSLVVDGGSGVIALSTATNAIDVLSFIYDGTNYLWSYGKTFN